MEEGNKMIKFDNSLLSESTVNFVLEVINTVSSRNRFSVIKNNKEIYNDLLAASAATTLTIPAIIYCIAHDDTQICKYGKIKQFTWYKNGFAFCGKRDACQCNKEEAVAKTKKTSLEKYGVESFAKTKLYKSKSAETCLQKYGVDHPSRCAEVRQKAKQTCLEKYGTEYPSQLDVFKEKLANTKLARHGDPNFSNAEKRKRTLENSYGVTNPTYINMDAAVLSLLQDETSFTDFVTGKTRQQIAYELKIDPNTVDKYCQKYNALHLVKVNNSSLWELKLSEFLNKNNISYIQNTKKIIPPYELDFYFPDFGFAIEINGNYWHSESKGKTRNYHFNKWQLGKNHGIDVYQYFEDELENSWEVITSKILYLCKRHSKKIGARKTTISRISFANEQQFYDKFHIQQSTKSRNVAYGAFFEGALVGVISLLKKTKYLEIVRYATRTDITTPGLFSKLLTYALKDIKYIGTVVSFSNNCHSSGNLYSAAGFKKEKIIGPAYYYTKNYKFRENRQGFMKSKIKKKFGVDIENKTEWQIMQALGYDRIWDAGKIKWTLNTGDNNGY